MWYSVYVIIAYIMIKLRLLINPPGSKLKKLLFVSKNKFVKSNPGIVIFQGGVIR